MTEDFPFDMTELHEEGQGYFVVVQMNQYVCMYVQGLERSVL